MNVSRRMLLAAAPFALPLAGSLVSTALADPPPAAPHAGGDPRLTTRALGNPAAPVHVQEWFSLTCTHCARFDQTVLPEVKAKLIDTGRVYYIFRDFPLDRVALLAAMVARALPPDRYAPFIDALFASQDRWAFAPGVDTKAELRQMAALAGLSGAAFDAVVADDAYQKAILAERALGADRYKIDSTPTFVFGSTVVPGEMTFDEFAAHVKAVAG